MGGTTETCYERAEGGPVSLAVGTTSLLADIDLADGAGCRGVFSTFGFLGGRRRGVVFWVSIVDAATGKDHELTSPRRYPVPFRAWLDTALFVLIQTPLFYGVVLLRRGGTAVTSQDRYHLLWALALSLVLTVLLSLIDGWKYGHGLVINERTLHPVFALRFGLSCLILVVARLPNLSPMLLIGLFLVGAAVFRGLERTAPSDDVDE